MSGRRWHWRALAYLVLVAVVNAGFAEDLRDGSELFEVLVFGAIAIAGEAYFERRGRKARLRAKADAAALRVLRGECPGPHSVTRWDCNGTPAEVETCSPLGTTLDEHLEQHTANVLAKAEELGCA